MFSDTRVFLFLRQRGRGVCGSATPDGTRIVGLRGGVHDVIGDSHLADERARPIEANEHCETRETSVIGLAPRADHTKSSVSSGEFEFGDAAACARLAFVPFVYQIRNH
jgi:hypothetical protein